MSPGPPQRLAQLLERPPYGATVAQQRSWLAEIMALLCVKGQPLARGAGLAPSTINRFLSEKSGHRLRAQTLDALVGEAKRLAGDAAVTARRPPGPHDAGAGSHLSLPVKRLDGLAEDPAQYCASDQNILFTRAFLHSLGPSDLTNLILVRVSGDAMAPTFAEGDHLLVDGGWTRASCDGLYLFRESRNHSPFVRRITLDPRADRLLVTTDNPAYAPAVSLAADEVRLLGRVLWVGRRL